jgi:hypothetical protein
MRLSWCAGKNKKAGETTGPCPLRHIGDIVIWEGNYKSDIFSIGKRPFFL